MYFHSKYPSHQGFLVRLLLSIYFFEETLFSHLMMAVKYVVDVAPTNDGSQFSNLQHFDPQKVQRAWNAWVEVLVEVSKFGFEMFI